MVLMLDIDGVFVCISPTERQQHADPACHNGSAMKLPWCSFTLRTPFQSTHGLQTAPSTQL